jgi:hypothetical protein
MEILMVKFTSNVQQSTSTVEVADIGNTRISFKNSQTSELDWKIFYIKIRDEGVNYPVTEVNYDYSIASFGAKALSPAVAKKLAVVITHLHTLNEQEQLDILNSINGDK